MAVANTTSGTALKIALAVYFLRLVRTRWQKWFVIFIVSFYGITAVVCTLDIPFRCGVPVSATKIFTSNDCALSWSTMLNGLDAAALANSICDCALAIIPFLLIWNTVKDRKSAKVAFIAVTSVAVLGTLTSVIRIPFLVNVKIGPTIFLESSIFCFLSLVETALGIIALSMASLMPLLSLWGQVLYRKRCAKLRVGNGRDVERGHHRHGLAPPFAASEAPSLQFDATVFGGLGILPAGTILTGIMRGGNATGDGRTQASRLTKSEVKSEIVVTVDEVQSLDGLGLRLQPRADKDES